MTVITLPPNDVIRVQSVGDLPLSEIDGLIGVVKDTDSIYVYNRPGGMWVLASGGGFVTSVTDTNSVDLTVTGTALSADVKLSAHAADAGNTIVALNTETDGLRAEILNNNVRGLFSATAPVTFGATTGVIAIPVSTNAVDGYLSAADHTTFAAKVGPTRAVNTTAPLAGGGNLSADLTLSIPKATAAVDGYLAATDFTTFNGKVSSARLINTTSPLTGGGDLSADRTLAIPAATTTVSGYLTTTDWNTFNNKVATTRTIATTAPLAGGGDLSANRTLSITQSATGADGYLSSVDWNTFNNKVGTARTIATTAPLQGGGDLSANRTLSISVATTLQDGYLASTDWNNFNNKVATTRSISTTAPLTGGGDLSANRTFAINQSTTTTDGYLSSTDWNTFNGKQTAITIGTFGTGATNGLVLTTGTLVLHAATATQPGGVSTGTQIFNGTKTFGGSACFVYRDSISSNLSFRSLMAITGTATSPTNLQSCSGTFGGFYALFYITDNTTGRAALLSANFSVGGISIISDSGSLFLATDAGTGIYVSKPSNSMVISFKNRLGATTGINVVALNCEITSIGAWA